MLCFSGAAVRVVATCYSFYFGLKCTWFYYLSNQELLRIMQVLFLFLVVLFSLEENYFSALQFLQLTGTYQNIGSIYIYIYIYIYIKRLINIFPVFSFIFVSFYFHFSFLSNS